MDGLRREQVAAGAIRAALYVAVSGGAQRKFYGHCGRRVSGPAAVDFPRAALAQPSRSAGTGSAIGDDRPTAPAG